jgi:aldehyde:ferredoxin oxidoreductase
MSMPGYAGKILHIDLTSGKTEERPLDPDLARLFLGGYGINNVLAHELIPPQVDPLAPENAVIIGAGPFNGTVIPGSSELSITTKFPLNGAIATGCGGGFFPLMMKSAGYDHIVITGRAKEKTALIIEQTGVELAVADDLWGKDVFQTVDQLRDRYPACSVIPIGISGENLVPASVTSIDKLGTVGAGGLPAIMGSKNLKAIVAVQGDAPVRVADTGGLLKIIDAHLERVMNYHLRPNLIREGAMGLTANWRGTGGKSASEETMERIAELHTDTRRTMACPTCPMADKESICLPEGSEVGKTYLTAFMGPRSDYGAEEPDEIFHRNMRVMDLENRLGIDYHNFPPALKMMTDLYQRGIINRETTGGIELDGSYETNLKLLDMTARREGFGNILAQGMAGALRLIDLIPGDHGAHVKGYHALMEARFNAMGTMEFESVVNPRGGVVASGALGAPSYNPMRPVDQYIKQSKRVGMSEEEIKRIFSESSFNAARLTRYAEDWFSLHNCLGLCHRLYISRFQSMETIGALFAAVTGMELSADELKKGAERSWVLWKMLNARIGFDRKDDRPPKIWFTPLKAGDEEFRLSDYYRTTELNEEDVERMLDDYYHERGWEKETGLPSREKIEELGLQEYDWR